MRIKKHKFIVLRYDHYTPLEIIRSLGKSNIKPITIIKNKTNKIVSKSKYLQKVYFFKNAEQQYELLLKNFGQQTYKSFVYPCDDNITTICDQYYDNLKDKFYISNAVTNGQITFYQEKNNISELAIRYGLNVARIWVTKKGKIPDDVVYLVITKTIASTSGSWKEDYYVCNSEKELLSAYF